VADKPFEGTFDDIAWCPGCGNFPIRKSLIAALQQLELEPTRTVLVSGIGQAAKLPHYVEAHLFNGLHGRALPAATAIKAVNPELTVIVSSGDGDMYAEGGNHLLHCLRRNPDLTLLVHNNMIYGLTKGQASPTSRRGMKTPVQTVGVFEEPFNAPALALTLGCGFVARSSAGEGELTTELLKRAVNYPGLALLDVFQPCVSFNKLNTYAWFKEHTYVLDEDHDTGDRLAAHEKALESDPLPLGLLYENPEPPPTFNDYLPAYAVDDTPLQRRRPGPADVERLLEEYRV
jgi:2-oxoglutarate ferredoxin oxidoreductase subunit beta